MRFVVVALGALALAALAAAPGPASAAKTKMGCERGKQVWDATAGRCVAGKSKYAGRVARKAAKKAGGSDSGGGAKAPDTKK